MIAATDVRKAYGPTVALAGVSLAVGDGEVVALLGPNGAGKTTLVEILEGFRRPDSGRVVVLGLDPRRHRARLAPRVGVMLQEGGLYPGLRVGEAVRLFAAYYDDPLPPGDVLASVGLGALAGRAVRRLSGGEKQRLSLALALVGRPRVLFLDEPTAGMDPRARATTWDMVRSLRNDGVTVLLTTHSVEEAERLADRVAVLDRGRLVALGTPAQLTAAAGGSRGGNVRFRAPADLDVAALGAALGTVVVEEGPGQYLVTAPPTPDLVAALTAWLAARGVTIDDLRAGRRSLEDVFLELTSG